MIYWFRINFGSVINLLGMMKGVNSNVSNLANVMILHIYVLSTHLCS